MIHDGKVVDVARQDGIVAAFAEEGNGWFGSTSETEGGRSWLACAKQLAEIAGHTGMTIDDVIHARLDASGYTIALRRSARATVVIVHLTGHPVVKSVNRLLRKMLVGGRPKKRARAEPGPAVPEAGAAG